MIHADASYCDVCWLPDGRLAFVYTGLGYVACDIDGVEAWRLPLPPQLVVGIDLRCGQDIHGLKALIKGADDRAYRVREGGVTPLEMTAFGNQSVCIDQTTGDEYVMVAGDTYAKNGIRLPAPLLTSQGIRDVIAGEIRWGDEWFVLAAGGQRFAQPAERHGVLVGQIVDDTDRIAGFNGTSLFVALGTLGHCFEPHVAARDGRFAICARTQSGAAYTVCPPWPPLDAPAPIPVPVPIPVPPIPVPEPPAFDIPPELGNQLPLVTEVRNTLFPSLVGQPLNDPEKAFFVTRHVAWRLRHLGVGLVKAKPGSSNNVDGFTSDIVALASGAHWDVLVDGHDGAAFPNWALEHDPANYPPIAARWVPASDPGGVTPDDPSEPSIDPAALRAQIAAEVGKAIAPLHAEIAALKALLAQAWPASGTTVRVALKGAHGTYVGIEPGGRVATDRDTAGPLETLDVEPQ